jgi:hypothetical protein
MTVIFKNSLPLDHCPCKDGIKWDSIHHPYLSLSGKALYGPSLVGIEMEHVYADHAWDLEKGGQCARFPCSVRTDVRLISRWTAPLCSGRLLIALHEILWNRQKLKRHSPQWYSRVGMTLAVL